MSSHAGHSHGSEGCVAAAPPVPASPLFVPTAPASLSAAVSRCEALAAHVLSGAAPPADCAPCADGGGGACPHAAEALSLLVRCAERARRAGLLPSRGERAADVSTAALRYLLLDFTAASLRARTPACGGGGGASHRLMALRTARDEFDAFVGRIVSIRGLLPSGEARAIGLIDALPHLADDLEEAAAAAAAEAGAGAPRRDAAAVRAAKIERFKRSAAAAARLRQLAALDDAARAAAHRRGLSDEAFDERCELDGVGAASAAGGAGGGGGAATASDDGVRREMGILALQSAVRAALDEIAAINQELPLLAHMLRVQQREGGGGGGDAAAAVAAAVAAAAAAGVLLAPFSACL